jgi:hypothetical protein
MPALAVITLSVSDSLSGSGWQLDEASTVRQPGVRRNGISYQELSYMLKRDMLTCSI